MTLVAETATLAHGFTMADVDSAAKLSSVRAFTRAIEGRERYDIAWLAIVEHLYSSGERLTFGELLDAGTRAVNKEYAEHRRHHGLPDRRDEQHRPSFVAYWSHHHAGSYVDFADGLSERMALPQVLSQLTPNQYEAITTLAVFDGDLDASAHALGLTYTAYYKRVDSARKRIKALWFAPETPSRGRVRRDGRCAYGHDLEEHGYLYDGMTRCNRCNRNAVRRRAARER